MTVIKINAITVPADSGDELGRRFAARAGAVDGQEGFEGFELLKPTDERTTWLVITRVAIDRFTGGADDGALFAEGPAYGGPSGASAHGAGGEHKPVAMSSELWSYEPSSP